MLYFISVEFQQYWGALRVFNYLTFRAAGAAITALLIAWLVGPYILRYLRGIKMEQPHREGTPETHLKKKATPTMGGLIILASIFGSALLWARLNNRYVLIALFVTAWMGAIGYIDDRLKIWQKTQGRKSEGLVEKYKLVGQTGLGLVLGLYLMYFPLSTLPAVSTTLPFFKYVLIVPATALLAWLYVPWVTFVLTGASNAVNLTDGLDGLATGLSAIAAATFAIFAYLFGRYDFAEYLNVFYLRGAGELTVVCTAIFGATVGFLWFNCWPAQVFMGDTGSLALGGAFGVISILLKSEFLLLIIGAVFVAETVSVLAQRYVFKYRVKRYGREFAEKNRVLKRAPLHHHYEEAGWSETQVVVRFWIIGILCAFLAIATLKLR